MICNLDLKKSFLAIAIAASSNAHALSCSLDTVTGTKTCTNNNIQENAVIQERMPDYTNLVVDGVNLNGANGMVIFGPGPEYPELANHPDLSLQINNSTIKSSSTNNWVYGGYSGIPAKENPAQQVSMGVTGSAIEITSGGNRANGVLLESGWGGSGSGYMSISNTHVTVNTTNTNDVGSSGVGVTANYISEITIDKYSSVTTPGDYTHGVAIVGDNNKINVLDPTLTNGHQRIDNQGEISTSGTASNAIHVVGRNDGSTTINNTGSVKHIGKGEGNSINVDAGIGSNTIINNAGTIFNENGSGVYYKSYANGGDALINNRGVIDVAGQNAKGIAIESANKTIINNQGEINSANTAIDVSSAQNTNITIDITNNGELNSDIDSIVSIINTTSSKSAVFNNNGEITGYVNLDALGNNTTASTMNNRGEWNVRDITNTDGIVNNNFGSSTLHGTLNNAGVITIDSSTTEASFNHVDITNTGSFTVADNYTAYRPTNINFNGNYISNGGSLSVRTDAQNLTTDQYNILGNASGSSKLYVNLINANNPQAIGGQGLEVVTVGGTNNLDLALGRPVTAGMYEYLLFKNTNNNWALGTHADQINPAVGAYLANQTAATSMFNHTLYDRIGQATFTAGKSTAEAQELWIKTNMQHSSYDSVGGKLSNRSHTYKIEFGSDLAVWRMLDGNFHVGVMGGYGDNETKSRSRATGSKVKGKVQGYNAGIYGTWFQNDDGALGLYVDTWTQYGWYRNRVEGDPMNSTKRYNSNVWSSSMEVGYGISLGKDATYEYLLTPQAQLTYKQYDADNQHDANDLYITSNNASGLDTRLGARLSARGVDKPRIEPYLELNWLNTNAKNTLKFNSTKLHDGIPDSRLEAKLGLQGHVTDRLSLGAQVSGNWGDNSYKEYQGTLNLSYKF